MVVSYRGEGEKEMGMQGKKIDFIFFKLRGFLKKIFGG
jgi:hypothetical protein